MDKKAKDIKTLFKKVKLLVLDVDGVLTKGEIVYNSKGEDAKVFNVKDGLGIFLLGKSGIKTVLLTARDSRALRHRAKDMGIYVYADILPKENVLPRIREKYKVKNQEICFVGDDLIDISVMNKIGVPVAVRDASPEVKYISVYVTKKNGGEGAVREIVENIMKSKNTWKDALKNIS